MAIFPGFTLAVPRGMLRRGAVPPCLNIAGGNWHHLSCYLELASQMPAPPESASPAVQLALDGLRSTVRSFGSAATATAALKNAQHEVLPDAPYAAIVWWLHLVGVEAQRVTVLLQQMGSGSDAVDALQELGGIAAHVRNLLQPLSLTVAESFTVLLRRHQELGLALDSLVERSQSHWESVGAKRVELARLDTEILEIGVLRRQRKDELAARRQLVQSELAACLAQAESIKGELELLEPLTLHGAWLKHASEELKSFLDSSRGAWTAFGSGCSQLAADYPALQAVDPMSLEKLVDRGAAIGHWTTLSQAAQQFNLSP